MKSFGACAGIDGFSFAFKALRQGNLAAFVLSRNQDFEMIRTILQDLRYGSRGLRRTPVFTAVVALSLALGIGANTALFSVIDARYLRKLPVPNPDELVSLSWSQKVRNSQLGDGLILRSNMSRVTFETLRARNTTLSELFAYTYPFRASARIDRDPESVSAQLISGTFFPGLGVPAAIGRMLAPDDDRSVAEPVVVISDQFWERRMSRD